MANKKRWTKEEEEILVQAIQANPHNISKALRTAGATINRSFKACQFHWYGVLSPKNNPNKIGISFVSIGPNTIYKNRKNSGNSTAQPEKNTLWTKIKKLIGLK